jgi:L-lactate dehydrogenase complex protein LldF
MTTIAQDFLTDAENKAFDTDHRRIINYKIGKYGSCPGLVADHQY